VHPDDRDYVDNTIKKGLNGKPHGIDYRIVLADGEERTVHTQTEVIFDDENTPVQLKGITQDVTERKKAEEKIQNLANIVESSNDAIITKSLRILLPAGIKAQNKFMVIQLKKSLEDPYQYLNQIFLKGK
jgi:PAS domain-containing protein